MPRLSKSLAPLCEKGAKISRLFLAFEEFLDLVEPGFRARIMARAVLLADGFEFTQQLALPLGQADRGLDHDVAEEISRFMAAHAADALRLEAEGLARLGFGRDADARRAVERRDRDLAPDAGGG